MAQHRLDKLVSGLQATDALVVDLDRDFEHRMRRAPTWQQKGGDARRRYTYHRPVLGVIVLRHGVVERRLPGTGRALDEEVRVMWRTRLHRRCTGEINSLGDLLETIS